MTISRRKEGFTLFEILVAVIILGIALPILFQLFAGTLRSAKKSKDYAQAITLARQKLDELSIIPTPPVEPESGEANGLIWERIVTPIDPFPDFPLEQALNDEDEEALDLMLQKIPLYEASVTVRLRDDPRGPSTTLNTFLSFAPLSPDAEDEDDDE